jgi:hypothetical protein
MDVTLDTKSTTEESPTGYLEMMTSNEEARTIWFALEEYKQKLVRTIERSAGTDTEFEDQKFCYHTLGVITSLQFDLLENHEQIERTKIQRCHRTSNQRTNPHSLWGLVRSTRTEKKGWTCYRST